MDIDRIVQQPGPTELPTPPSDDSIKIAAAFSHTDEKNNHAQSPVSSEPPLLDREWPVEDRICEETTSVEERKKPSLDDFQMLTTLGTGTFARVCRVAIFSV